ncbi:coiled-coil domain-containing protein 27 [Pelodytes ibericus]
MKEGIGLKMQGVGDLPWSGCRRPRTATWRIPKSDARRGNGGKSAQGIRENPSPVSWSSPASSLDSTAPQIITLQTYNGTTPGCYKLSSLSSFTERADEKLPLIQLPNDLPKTHMSIGSPTNLPTNGDLSSQTYLTCVEIKTPWYITILHEKERCLLKLGEEINRLSRYEEESRRKDDIICTLREEIWQLQSDLDQAVQTKNVLEKEDTALPPSNQLNRPSENDQLDFGEPHIGLHITEKPADSGSSGRNLDNNPEDPVKASISVTFDLDMDVDKREMIQMETESLRKESAEEVQIRGLEDGCMQVPDLQADMSQLQDELDTLKKDHDMTKGMVISLQRIVSLQESQLRKTHSEKEVLQRELSERGMQIQAMSAKFSCLREERKHVEIMATIEKENYSLRELVSELKSELTKRNDMIGNFKNDISNLQKEVAEYEIQTAKYERDKREMQSKAEDLEYSEQCIKVSLEGFQSRFERFRSKILQATFSPPGTKCPQVQITDNEILEAMQKIISDRADYHQQLKLKGVSIQPLHTSENGNIQKQSSSRKKINNIK